MLERGSVLAALIVAACTGFVALENMTVAAVSSAALVYVVAVGWRSVLGRIVHLVIIATLLAAHTASRSHFTPPIVFALLYA